jgi:DNA-binding beta-propeller fold protein YncE
MHVFPTLHKLERKYPKELVVIGVHSAKFTNEKDADCVRQAILRHNLEHPVVNDEDFKIFRSYGARGWPHFFVVDPEGNIVAGESGEIPFEAFVRVIDGLIKRHEGKLDRRELKWKLERDKEKRGTLWFPGKVLASGDRLYIADSMQHRILVTDLAGKVLEKIGSGEEGWQDGSFETARFDEPLGVAPRGDLLYIADRENHCIRAADLRARTVKTLAGTGKQGWRSEPVDPLKTALNSPWDLALDGDRLFIAMAGNHQIWVMDLKKNSIAVFSGTGRETLTDGPHSAANYSQPSGLVIGNGKLYVADAEVSGVRELDLEPDGKARTLVGTGLFEFGDVDGVGDAARLQHTIGVGFSDGLVFVADAYNHKIKTVDPKTRLAKSVFGDGKRGAEDGTAARFYEPSAVSALNGKLYVADTNNHRIRVCDLKSGKVSTLPIEFK